MTQYNPRKRWLVYVLRCGDGSLYTGVTNDLGNRLKAHLAGKGSRYVGSRLPARVVWKRGAASHSAALRREAEIKRMSKGEKETLVRGKAVSG